MSSLRTIGLLMLLAAPSLHTARRRIAHWRALITEEQSSLLLRLDDPGSLLAFAGVTLLEIAANAKR
jgi:hypothetical protein